MLKINAYPLARGLASYILPSRLFKQPGSGGTISGEYCYSVWHRHLYYLMENRLIKAVDQIKKVAEIGPGDSLGIGMASLYSGAEEYYAFDVIEHANMTQNKIVNDELLSLFSSNCDIPNTHRQQNTHPQLPDYSFPKHYLGFGEKYYKDRHEEINDALEKGTASALSMDYVVPWLNASRKNISEIDLIFSQAVMEHVADIELAYSEMFRWLRKGGVISHQIDFKTHEMTEEWNGHWFIGNLVWRVLSHGRKYPLNRLPLSSHIKMIEKAGFEIRIVIPVIRKNELTGLVPKVKNESFSEEDLITSGALVQAVK